MSRLLATTLQRTVPALGVPRHVVPLISSFCPSYYSYYTSSSDRRQILNSIPRHNHHPALPLPSSPSRPQRRQLHLFLSASANRPHVLHRPHLPPSCYRLAQHRTLFIQTQTTPNVDALKFFPGVPLLPATCAATTTVEYLSGRSAHSSPLARKLFALDGVSSVFFTPAYMTVTKARDASWAHLKPEVFSLLTEALNSGAPVVLGAVSPDGVWRVQGAGGAGTEGDEGVLAPADTQAEEGDSEVVSMIKELLDTRIRPTIQDDGGDIEYRGFDEETGTVKLKLRGACRTCDSSTVTLKNGIESMLMHYVCIIILLLRFLCASLLPPTYFVPPLTYSINHLNNLTKLPPI